jgi:hypothetical protein
MAPAAVVSNSRMTTHQVADPLGSDDTGGRHIIRSPFPYVLVASSRYPAREFSDAMTVPTGETRVRSARLL